MQASDSLKIATLVAALIGTAMPAAAQDAERFDRFERADTDGDGRLTPEELDAARTARFAAIDTDGDGQLTAEELTAAQSERVAERVERMLSMRDADGDGTLSIEELPAPLAEGDRFARLDRNDDGAISREEFRSLRRGFGGRDKAHGRDG